MNHDRIFPEILKKGASAMIKSFMSKTLFAAVISACVSATALAGWDWLTPYQGPKNDIITLVITSNYNQPRMLADVIMSATSQPYILLPTKEQTKIFFVPGHNKAALEIKEADLTRFICFVNPQQIIVLGDERYIPAKYMQSIPDEYTSMIVYNSDWQKVAKTLGLFFNKVNIYYDYKKLSNRFNGKDAPLYIPTTRKYSNAGVEPDAAAAKSDVPVVEKGAADAKSNVPEPATVEPMVEK